MIDLRRLPFAAAIQGRGLTDTGKVLASLVALTPTPESEASGPNVSIISARGSGLSLRALAPGVIQLRTGLPRASLSELPARKGQRRPSP